jgi:hypothetical protein
VTLSNWQWAVAVQVADQVAVPLAETTEKVRQHFQVETAVTQDHNHIQEQVAGQVEPQQYS